MMDMVEERVYTIPLKEVFEKRRGVRAKMAAKLLKRAIAKNMKVNDKDIRLNEELNKVIWRGGIQKPPRRIKVWAKKGEDHIVFVDVFKEGEKKIEEEKK